MTAITTTNLSWSGTWSEAPVVPDAAFIAYDGLDADEHGTSASSPQTGADADR